MSLEKPWINATIIENIEERNKLYRLYLESNTQEDLERFKQARNLNSLRRSTVRDYYPEQFYENTGDTKGTWQITNDALKGDRKNCKIDVILVNGKQLVELKHIADEFCEYLSKIGTLIKSVIAQSSGVSMS